jgi:superfamily II DNA helicase RecQ
MISDFLDDRLDDAQLEQFLNHIEHCQDCYDELEVYYMITEGLMRLEEQHRGTLDLKKDLKRLLKEKRQGLYSRQRRQHFRKTIREITALCSICLVIFLLHIFMIGSGSIHSASDFRTLAADTIRQNLFGVSEVNRVVDESVAKKEAQANTVSPVERRQRFEQKHPFMPSYFYFPNAGLLVPEL